MASRLGLALTRSIARTSASRMAPITISQRSFAQLPKGLSCAKVSTVCDKWKSATPDQRFLASSIALGTCIPIGLLLAPSVLAVPFDFVIGVAMPYHFYHGLHHIADDYIKNQYANYAIVVVCCLAALGFLKINLCGPGLSASLKSLWYKPEVRKN